MLPLFVSEISQCWVTPGEPKEGWCHTPFQADFSVGKRQPEMIESFMLV